VVDQQRVADLYRRHVPAMRRFAYLMLGGDRDRADDLVHDAFIRTVARMPAMRDPERFESYLRQSVANAVTSWGRRRAVERRWFQLHATAHEVHVADVAPDEVGGADQVVRLLTSLPTRQRLAVTARICLDLSESQTAELLGCSIGNVKSLTSRGLATLRAHVDPGVGATKLPIREWS
jgi:RNA polymerase sigma factor (sigma-70 family)